MDRLLGRLDVGGEPVAHSLERLALLLAQLGGMRPHCFDVGRHARAHIAQRRLDRIERFERATAEPALVHRADAFHHRLLMRGDHVGKIVPAMRGGLAHAQHAVDGAPAHVVELIEPRRRRGIDRLQPLLRDGEKALIALLEGVNAGLDGGRAREV